MAKGNRKKIINIDYDNTASGIVADNVQDAIDEVLSSATNIYTSDGTIAANRNVDLNNHSLTFNNMAQFAMYGANAELEYDGSIFKVAANGVGEMEYGHQDSMMCYATQTDVEFEIKSTAQHVKFTDTRASGSQIGVEYNADYSADFVDRSLVDKAYVDNNHGTLQQAADASIAADGYVHVEFGASVLEDDGGAAVWEPLPGGYELEFKDGGHASIYLKSETSAGAGDSVFAFRDGRTGVHQTGVVYQGDYSAGFVDRSLVDKEYVDNAIIAGTVNIYNTDGTLTGNRAIDGGGSAGLAFDKITDFYINGAGAFPGARYSVDYSANYTARSLVDKEYVDSKVGSSIYDTDIDTGIETERTADDDTIYFQSAGQDVIKIKNTLANGKTIAFGDFDGDGNETKLEFSDGAQSITFNGLYANFGDIEGNGNEVIFTVSDPDKMVQAYQTNLSVSPATGAVDTGDFRMYQDPANGTNYVGFKSPSALAGSQIWTLPDGDGAANEVLYTNGAGVLGWKVATNNNIYNADGTLTGARTLTGAGNSLNFSGMSDFNINTPYMFIDTGGGAELEIDDEVITWTSQAGQLLMDTTDISLGDNRSAGNRHGLEYAANYSADYTNRSLVDKEYVDGHVGTSLFDADADTGIQTERTADDDTIWFQTAGNNAMMIDNTGKVRVSNDNGATGRQCLFEVGTGCEASTFGVQADSSYLNIATFRDEDGENIFRAKGALSSSDLQVTFGDADEAYNGAGMIVDVGATRGNIDIYNSDLRLLEGSHTSAHAVGLKSPSGVTADHIWALPDNDGLANHVLTTDGSHGLGFTSPTMFTNASNGLTRAVSGQTSIIELGGHLTKATNIDATNYDFSITDADELNLSTTNGTWTGLLEMHPASSFLGSSDGSGTTRIQVGGTGIILYDGHVGKGATYGGDYHAGFVKRSLVDKEYVDNRTGYVQLVNQAMTTLNGSTTGTEVLWNATATHNSDAVNYQVDTDGVVVPAGDYEVYVSIYNESTSARVNVATEILIDGVGQGVIGAGGYIRNQSGHDESSTSVKQIVTCADGDKISARGIRLAAAGTVTTPADKSVLIINKLQ